jgi:ariadne-1
MAKTELKCPSDRCNSFINICLFKDLLSEDIILKFQEAGLKAFVDSNADQVSWCPTPECNYVFVLEAKFEENNFYCPLCKRQ